MGGHRRQDCIGPTARAYRVWKQLRVFEHGDMNEPGRALDTFLEHARIAGALDTESHLPRIKVKGANFNVLETRARGFAVYCRDRAFPLFERAGLECHLPRVIRWEKLPTPRIKLHASFRQLPEEDLLVSGFDLMLRRKG